MTVHVAVADPLPMFQQGLAAVLTSAGYMVEVSTDNSEWTPQAGCSVVLLTVGVESDWERLGQLRDGRPEIAVIVLVEGEPVASGVRAIRTGARSVLPRNVVPGVLERAVHTTVDGHAVIPATVAAALAEGTNSGNVLRTLSPPPELPWLKLLAGGMTVARLATEAGYSERAMYRLLHKLYRRLGVRNRVQAILLAQQQGWLRMDTRRQ